jgi:predicted ATPase
LLFDGCEHLVEPSARVIAAIARRCPYVTTFASSRQALGVGGEATYHVPPLATPHDQNGAALTAVDAARYAAIALFSERARASDHRFALTDENAPIVADICRRLDGIALAIELAAARARILSPAQLRDKLAERFRLLTGGARDVSPRQQTLRAMIDWSHDHLDDRERTLFRRLGIFVDGFTLEGASAVASDEDVDAFDAFDLVASLVEKSLVLAESGGDSSRYRLLESTRAYALEKLREAGERERLADRNLRYLYHSFSELRKRQEATADSAGIVAALARELEGVRFALDDALARSGVVAGARLLAAIGRSWNGHGFVREGVARHEAFIAALPRAEILLLAELSATLAGLLCDRGTIERALAVATNACAYARAAGDGPTLALALRWYAQANIDLLDFDNADAALNEMAAISSISTRLRAILTDGRIALSLATGDLDAAAHGCGQMIADQRALGNLRGVHVAVHTLAEVEHARGRTARSIALLREVLPALRLGLDAQTRTASLANLAGYLVACDDPSGAMEAAHEAIETLAREPEHYLVTVALEHVALADALEGRLPRAALLASYADEAYRKNGAKREYTERITNERLVSLLDANLAPDVRATFAAEGAALTPEAAVALGLGRQFS